MSKCNTNCSECSTILSPYLLSEKGIKIGINHVNYNSSFGNYFMGDCVCNPSDNYCKCCTFNEQSSITSNINAPCQIVNGRFIEHHGVWRSCEEKRYRLRVNNLKSIEYNNYLEHKSYNEFIYQINKQYEGIKVDTSMGFNSIREKLVEYLKLLPTEKDSSYEVVLGILPKAISKYNIGCNCQQTVNGIYSSEDECLASQNVNS